MKIKNTEASSNLGVKNQTCIPGDRKRYEAEFKQQILDVWNSGA